VTTRRSRPDLSHEMATQVPKTGSFDWLLRAAAKLEKATYRKSNHKYREKIKALNDELDRYKLQCEIMIPTLQVEVRRLKEELEIKTKRCIDLEMCQKVSRNNSDNDYEWLDNLNFTDEDNENSEEDIDSCEEETILEKSKGVIKSNKESTEMTATKSTKVEKANNTEPKVEKLNDESIDSTEPKVGKLNKESIDGTKKIDKINITEISKIATPNDLLTVLTPPDTTNPESQVQQQPPGSPKKRTRSSSPPTNNLTPDSSPLFTPAMTKTLGLGQGVKRKRRKK